MGTLQAQLSLYTGSDETQVKDYVEIFNLISSVSAVITPGIGIALDRWGFTRSIFVSILIGTAYAVTVLVDNFKLQIVSFVCYCIFRTFLFSIIFAYLPHKFGFRYFGVLSGYVL